jgi:hypothetical protein
MLCAHYSDIIRAGILGPFEYAVPTGLEAYPTPKIKENTEV